jgi:monofunctional biosynthetic peptidoglycan transglycosylase
MSQGDPEEEAAAPPHAVEPPDDPSKADASPDMPEAAGPKPEPATEPAPEATPPAFSAEALPRKRRRWVRVLLIVLAGLLLWPPVSVLALKVLPPPPTILMLQRLAQGRGLERSWRPLDRIAPSLVAAVIAAEDARFCAHDGFDWEAIRAAAAHNARSKTKVRGGSTITQQTAKNVFLWPSRDYVRKGLEAGYTVLIEKLWGKRRILEVYLNVVEWGPGVYGAQAAARRYFHVDASQLTPQQSARLAAILPSPLKWKAVNPGRYVARRSRSIGANAAVVRADDMAACIRR